MPTDLKNFDGDCPIVAVATITGKNYLEVKQLATKKYKYKGNGLPAADAISLAWDYLGKYKRVIPGPDSPKGFTGSAEDFAVAYPRGRWMVYTKGHVMPLVNGILTNKNGWGEEPITFAAEF